MLMRILLALDNPVLEGRLRVSLKHADTIVETLNPMQLQQQLVRTDCDLVVISRDVAVANDLAKAVGLSGFTGVPAVVVLCEKDDEAEIAQFIAEGFEAVLNATLPTEKLANALKTILDKRRTASHAAFQEVKTLREPRLSDFDSCTLSMKKFLKVASRVACSNSTVLICGETGVGKERLALALHSESPRREGPFVPVHCAALPESLLESELFGHEVGAFTGATRSHRGCFEVAHGGTILLDEIAEVPIHLQAKLLRVLENHEIRRVGGEKAVRVDVRIIAATNRDLETEVEAKRFRQDLYYRLNVVSLTVPPLRERIGDIPDLALRYINRLRAQIGCEVFRIDHEALNALCQYSWPGNVRELINVIERAMLLCEGDSITCHDLPAVISKKYPPPIDGSSIIEKAAKGAGLPDDWLGKPLRDVRKICVEGLERIYLTELLRSTNGRIGQTARQAGINERTLFQKMRRYGLNKKQFRQ